MIIAHKISLDPTEQQARALAMAAGVSRFAWNWALAEWNRQYAAGEKPTALKLKKQWNSIKRGEFPWVLESPRGANHRPFAPGSNPGIRWIEGGGVGETHAGRLSTEAIGWVGRAVDTAVRPF